MLIHLSPRLYVGNFFTDACALVDFRIDALGLHLRCGQELVARRPYPNKRYLVACRNVGKKAINGILINTPEHMQGFTAETRWSIDAETIITHRTQYLVLDNEFGAVTESMVLWYATSESLGNWRSRWPEMPDGATPANCQPCMDIFPATRGGIPRVGSVKDRLSAGGDLVIERNEICRLPTVEPERLLGGWEVEERLPSMEAIFQVC